MSKHTSNRRNVQSRNVTFSLSGSTIESVESYKYLGRHITADNDDWLAVSRNLKKARSQWGRIQAILKKETTS